MTERKTRSRQRDLRWISVFTTGEAARACKVKQSTIIRCARSGKLKCRMVPGSTHRRIDREALLRFMREHRIPTDAIDPVIRVAILDADSASSSLVERLRGDTRFAPPVVYTEEFSFGMAMLPTPPALAIVRYALLRHPGCLISKLESHDTLRDLRLIVVGVPSAAETDRLVIADGPRLRAFGPVDAEALFEAILALLPRLPADA